LNREDSEDAAFLLWEVRNYIIQWWFWDFVQQRETIWR
jgi:hypothetical protein